MHFFNVLSGSRRALLAAMLGLLLASSGCSGGGGGQPRGLFTGYVMDQTEEEVAGKIGKPDAVDTTNANTPKWIYKKKTFDPDNLNQVDNETILIFQKDPVTQKFKVIQVIFA